MTRRQAIEVGAVVWAVVGLIVGVRVLQSVNADARVLVLVACVVGAGAALLASACLSVHRDRLAGALLARVGRLPDGVRLGVERPRGARGRGARDRADLGALGAARPSDLAVERPQAGSRSVHGRPRCHGRPQSAVSPHGAPKRACTIERASSGARISSPTPGRPG